MKPWALKLAGDLRSLWMLLILCIALSIASPVFATSNNLLNVGLAASVTALLAVGQTFVIILGEIDLSVGSALSFSAAVTALTLRHHSLPVGLAAGIGVGALIGLINGILVTRARMPSFIATLAMMSALAGLALEVTHGNPVSVSNYDFQNIGQAYALGIPVPVWMMVVVVVLFGLLLARTRFGRYVHATGDNREAARLSGIPTTVVVVLAFVISGCLAALAGFIITARLSTAEPTAGTGMELEAIAAVIIGGTSLAGGRGDMLGTVVGALILGVIDNGMNLLNVSPFLQSVVKGLVILFAVLLDRNASVVRQWFRRAAPPDPSSGSSSGPPAGVAAASQAPAGDHPPGTSAPTPSTSTNERTSA